MQYYNGPVQKQPRKLRTEQIALIWKNQIKKGHQQYVCNNNDIL